MHLALALTTLLLAAASSIAADASPASSATTAPAPVPKRSADVTERIVGLVKDGHLSVPVDNDVLGVDPSEGDLKKLRVEFTVGGRVRSRAWAEGQTAEIAAPKGEKLVVTRAIYGVSDEPVDVTSAVAGALKDNALDIEATNEALGIDPDPGPTKQLVVLYAIDGVHHIEAVEERQPFRLVKPDGGAKLTIVRATYGVPVKWFDVLEIVESKLKDSKLSITADNELLGDPSFGDTKTLRVEYAVAGKPHTAEASEQETIDIPAAADGAGTLVITRARYGVLGG